MTKPTDSSWNRDDQQKTPRSPGGPQRMAQEPDGAQPSVRTPKTATDPASGETNSRPPAPNRAQTDQTAGVSRQAPEPGRS